MFQARLKNSRRDVFATQIDEKPVWYTAKHPLICSKCEAGVHGKGTYVKHSGASYRAHFALNPQKSHEETCPFSPVRFITNIAHGAQGLADVDDGVLRLTLPENLQDIATEPETTGPELPPQEATGRRISTVPPPLPPLMNCAAKIARFLQLNAFDPKVVSRFKVHPHGYKSTIPWSSFCYGPTAASYGDLVERLDPATRRRAPSYPVAVYGTVQRVDRDRKKGRPYVFLADHADLDGREFEVVLRSMHPTLIKPLTVGTHVLAVGQWEIFSDGRVPQLRLFAKEAWQIAYWHTDDTGATTQPASPPALTAYQRATERPARGAPARTRQPSGPNPARRKVEPYAQGTQRKPVPNEDKGASKPENKDIAAPAPAAPPRPASAKPTQRETTATDAPPPKPPLPAPSDSGTPSAPAPPEHQPEAPTVPPRPHKPPRPPMPPAQRRRKGLAGWLSRRPRRRRG